MVTKADQPLAKPGAPVPPEQSLELFPDRTLQLNERAPIRSVIVAAPRCPVDSNNPEKWGPAAQNCASTGYKWWERCPHDPYYGITRVAETVDEVDAEGWIIGSKTRYRDERTLNTNRVPVGTRFGSGRQLEASLVLKGRKRLSEFGLHEPCQFHRCERPSRIKSKYGLYCNERHARLCGGDIETVIAGVGSPTAKAEYEKELAALDISDGIERIQVPPDLNNGVAPSVDQWADDIDAAQQTREEAERTATQ